MALVGSNRTLLSSSGYINPGAAASAFLARAGVLDRKHSNAYTQLINGMVADGTWSIFDLLYIFATQNSTVALLNLVSSNFAATITGTITFAVDRGLTGTASTGSYINSNFTPSTAGGNYSLNSASAGAYNRTNRTTAQAYANAGTCNTLTTSFDYLLANYTGNLYYLDINGFNGINTAAITSQGLLINVRSSNVAIAQYLNGNTTPIQSSGANASVALSDQTYLVLARRDNIANDVGNSADQLGAFFLSGVLSAAQTALVSNRINSFMSAVGANVY